VVSLQIISKVIATSDNSIIDDNQLTEDYFEGYREEYNFIQDHINEYGNVPDKATFLSKFPSVELVEVAETDRYLVDTIREEYLFAHSTPVLKQWAKMLQTDSNAANEYLSAALVDLQPNYSLGGTDIIAQAAERHKQFVERKQNPNNWFFESGFKELDEIIHGVQREEELIVLVARTNQGKSFVLQKICSHIWKTGFNVGYMSPEMSPSSVGFRFDTLFNHFSNKGLMWGKDSVDDDQYNDYINNLQSYTNKFIVSTPADLGRQVTVSKIRNWIKKYKLDVVAIDGITYMSDERAKRGDNKTTSLTNISEDLMSLSVEMGVPIIVVVQANRSGVVEGDEDGTPELESIRDSDGIAHNASKVLSIRQKKDSVLEIGVKKQRSGPVGGHINYSWDIDTGNFTYIPNDSDSSSKVVKEKSQETRKKIDSGDKADVF